MQKWLDKLFLQGNDTKKAYLKAGFLYVVFLIFICFLQLLQKENLQ